MTATQEIFNYPSQLVQFHVDYSKFGSLNIHSVTTAGLEQPEQPGLPTVDSIQSSGLGIT